MKKYSAITILLLLCLLLGCTSQTEDDPLTVSGKVTELDGNNFLLEVTEPDDFDSVALTVTDDTTWEIDGVHELQNGDLITVSIGSQIMESHPVQATLHSIIDLVPATQPQRQEGTLLLKGTILEIDESTWLLQVTESSDVEYEQVIIKIREITVFAAEMDQPQVGDTVTVETSPLIDESQPPQLQAVSIYQ